ncbi:WecB/TagA/CpsF family glycosyltransferase [Geodermatophilus sp. CPCC 206100]|uniref:WecB/TagA/CpsF family glycosyltransferase n=1 Tax=Geodermatophilus sp. CPCC 206100 TaxID=3020054 RepID=UPI003AFFCE5E
MIDVVDVGPFRVVDARRDELTRDLVQAWVRRAAPIRVFSLHVGGLNLRRDAAFVDAVNQAEWLCADGAAVVLVARLAGSNRIERAPTTDLAHAVLRELRSVAGRTVTFGVIGGPEGLADRAAERLTEFHDARCVVSSHGYRSNWQPVLDVLAQEQPDVVFVGMGMPKEALWVTENLPSLPPSLYLTCGGWFGFLVGDESRAPAAVQRFGGEWLWRAAQSPRLLPRYARGVVTTIGLLPGAVGARRRTKKARVR